MIDELSSFSSPFPARDPPNGRRESVLTGFDSFAKP